MPVTIGIASGCGKMAVLVDEEDVAGSTRALSGSSGEGRSDLGILAVDVVVFLDIATLVADGPEVQGRLAAGDGEGGGGSGGTSLDEGSGVEVVGGGVVGSIGPGVFDDFLGILVLDVDALVKDA